MLHFLVTIYCTIFSDACGARGYIWQDAMGKDRSTCASVSDSDDCDRLSGVNKKGLGYIEWQEASQRSEMCMKRRGWVLADSWEFEDHLLHCRDKK